MREADGQGPNVTVLPPPPPPRLGLLALVALLVLAAAPGLRLAAGQTIAAGWTPQQQGPVNAGAPLSDRDALARPSAARTALARSWRAAEPKDAPPAGAVSVAEAGSRLGALSGRAGPVPAVRPVAPARLYDPRAPPTVA